MSILYYGDTALEIFSILKPKGTIILADGLPGNPLSKKDAIVEWNNRGYDIVFPRYLGTWESKGSFLKHPPQLDMQDLVKVLIDGIEFHALTYKAQKIYFLGSSFGGGVILSIKESSNIQKICALSPVISYKDLPSMNTLASYLQTKQGENYRFELFNFNNLLLDKISSPINCYSLPSNKVMILGGELDDQIPINLLRDFSNIHTIELYTDPKAGHITLSKLTPDNYDLIDKFFCS